MNPLKKLAGQTAIYGVPSILGRFLNYLLVTLHTDVLNTAQYGVYSDLYTYVAYIIMVYSFGMETTFFRFANKANPREAYRNAGSFIFYLSTFVSVNLVIFSPTIASLLGYEGKAHYIIWLAVILWIDALVALPFAQLRYQNKPVRFAVYRLVNVILVIVLQIFLLGICPKIHEGSFLPVLKPLVDLFFIPDYGVEYIIIANLIANAFYIIFLLKPILQIRFRINWQTFKPMFWYALPITITGIAGITNERLDIILLGDLLPEGFYPGKTNQDVQGIYGASVKLSVLMILGNQAFRFAAEPFFFSSAKDKNAPDLFARVFHYFVIAAVIVFVGVSVNKEFIATELLRSPEFREVLMVVPWLLIGKLFMGVYTNFAIWFKIIDKTIFGAYFALTGAFITITANFFLIPKVGYMAPAYASILAYFTMAVVCYGYGQKHFPIPYNLKVAFLYLLAGILAVYVLGFLSLENKSLEYPIKLVITFVLVGVVFLVERKNLMKREI